MEFLKNKSYLVFFVLGLLGFLLSSCERLEIRDTLESDSSAPGIITDLSVENLPGGATISYTLPDDDDLLYVQAQYEIRPGIKQEVRASYYNKSLTVLGFGDINEYSVSLYSVDRSGNKSSPVSVTVNPLKAPVQSAFEGLSYERDFGGITMVFQNEAKADLAATILIKDAFDDWIEYDRYYTGLPDGFYSVRGLPAEPTIFGVYISDRWDNSSDTLIQQATPLFEKQLNKKLFSHVPLPGDAANTWKYPSLWDDVTTSNAGFKAADALPKRFQFDVGSKVKLSRFKIWGVFGGREYSSANLKEFELWGSNAPNPDGSFDGWTLIEEYEVVRPSGLSVGDELTADDIQMATDGFEFVIPAGAPSVKYIRFNFLSSFASPRNSEKGEVWLREFTFWGQEAE